MEYDKKYLKIATYKRKAKIFEDSLKPIKDKIENSSITANELIIFYNSVVMFLGDYKTLQQQHARLKTLLKNSIRK